MGTHQFWIYQSETHLSEDQESAIRKGMQDILNHWKSHGTPVPGRFDIRHGHFLLVEAAPGTTSGCSIDSLNKLVSDLLRDNQVVVLDHGYIPYRNNHNIQFLRFNQLENAVADGTLGPETIIFDHSQHPFQMEGHWETKARNTWVSRYFLAV